MRCGQLQKGCELEYKAGDTVIEVDEYRFMKVVAQEGNEVVCKHTDVEERIPVSKLRTMPDNWGLCFDIPAMKKLRSSATF